MARKLQGEADNLESTRCGTPLQHACRTPGLKDVAEGLLGHVALSGTRNSLLLSYFSFWRPKEEPVAKGSPASAAFQGGLADRIPLGGACQVGDVLASGLRVRLHMRCQPRECSQSEENMNSPVTWVPPSVFLIRVRARVTSPPADV